jgi:hypothetical protein
MLRRFGLRAEPSETHAPCHGFEPMRSGTVVPMMPGSSRRVAVLIIAFVVAACSVSKKKIIEACERGEVDACQRACAADHGPACQLLGAIYLEGVGVEIDIERGLELMARACELGVQTMCLPSSSAHETPDLIVLPPLDDDVFEDLSPVPVPEPTPEADSEELPPPAPLER